MKNGGLLLVTDAKLNWSFVVIKPIATVFLPAKYVWLKGNMIIGDVLGSWNSKDIEL